MTLKPTEQLAREILDQFFRDANLVEENRTLSSDQRTISKNAIEIIPATGRVTIQAKIMSRTICHDRVLCSAPIPTIAPVDTCVVDIGAPKSAPSDTKPAVTDPAFRVAILSIVVTFIARVSVTLKPPMIDPSITETTIVT
jgi:hypothetical protein